MREISAPSRADIAILAVAVTAISTSAPIIAACAAPALAIAMWRCLLGSAAMGLSLILRPARWPASSRQWRAAVLGGLLLGLHFAAWVPSLRFTSVASSTALVATQPVWAALIAQRRGVRVPRAAWAGVAVSLAGVLLLTGIDLALDPVSLIGNGLALLGGVLAACYVSVGEAARRDLGTQMYTFVGYAAAALVLLSLTWAAGVPLTGYSARDWMLILALTVLAQLLGHSLINRLLGSVSATVTSLAILFEVPGAVVIAALWLGALPPLAVLPALALILAGLIVVVRAATR